MVSHGFSIRISNDGSNIPETFKLVISRYVNGETVPLDTLVVDELPFAAEVKVNRNVPGLFFLNVAREINRAEFIWSPNDDGLSIETNYWSLKNGFIEIANSSENQAYSELLTSKNLVDGRTEELEMRLRTISAFDKDYKRQMAAIEDSIEMLALELDIQLQMLGLRYPNTFTASTLVGLSQMPSRKSNATWFKEYDGYLALMNEHYFDFINVGNPYLLNHYALKDKIVLYLDRYT